MFSHILVPVDGSEPSRAGLIEAHALAEAHGARLDLLHVIDDAPVVDDLGVPVDLDRLHRNAVAKAQRLLEKDREFCARRGRAPRVSLHELGGGRVADGIVQRATELGCDLIVIGTHGRRWLRRALLGSDAEDVLRSSPVPVLLVRNGAVAHAGVASTGRRIPYQAVLVPFDGSPTSVAGLDLAIRLTAASGGPLRLLHVIDDQSLAIASRLDALQPGGPEQLRERADLILSQGLERARAAGVAADAVQMEAAHRRLWDIVAAEATRWPADVIVLGSHGRRGIERVLLGSDAEQIVRHAPVPVLLVRAALEAAALDATADGPRAA